MKRTYFLHLEKKRQMKVLLILILFLFVKTGSAQLYKQHNFENSIYGLTTIVKTIKNNSQNRYYYSGQGSGFFYHQYSDSLRVPYDSKINSIDSSLSRIWLITNKHVLFGDNYASNQLNYPDAFEFYLRKIDMTIDRPKWDTLRLALRDLKLLTKFHKDSTTDVIAINVTQFVLPKLLKGDSLYYYGAVSKANFPTESLPSGWEIGVGYDLLSIGYPKEFYDTYNLFPTIKSGILASKWKYKYDGKPFFLIDSKLFPGSSGSIIISRPIKYGLEGNINIDYFQFLGVYSGEFYRKRETVEFEEMTITKRENYNTGNVWYYYLIEEIIK
jgi:hypothetical protein